MTDKNVVLKSINNHNGTRCVDFFQRPDNTFGFEEYRRDEEDNRGWFPVGNYRDQAFDHEDDAFLAAQSNILWLKIMLKG